MKHTCYKIEYQIIKKSSCKTKHTQLHYCEQNNTFTYRNMKIYFKGLPNRKQIGEDAYLWG